jgi:arylsulfatase A-like enzyme
MNVPGARRWPGRQATAPLLGLLFLAPGCARRVPDRPDILLVTIDTLRADHCSAYGYGRPTTPRLDALAARGVRFQSAYAPMATTSPAHATLFSGMLPLWHGLTKNGQVLEPGQRLLAGALRGAGYRTSAVVSSFVLDRRFGLAAGFDDYDDRFSGSNPSMKAGAWEGHKVETPFDRRGDETRARAAAWLRAQGYLQRERPPGQAPFFLWVHFFDPHSPYDPPPAHRDRFPPRSGEKLDREIAAYDAEIHFADEALGGLLDELAAAGTLERTLTVVTADHGEGLMQHGHMEHGLQIYEEAVRVPLVVHWPARLGRPRVVEGPVLLADLAPTLAEVAGLSWPEHPGQGRSLAAILHGRAAPDVRREVLLQRRRYDGPLATGEQPRGAKFALRAGRWKYIEAQEEGTFELYDVVDDPGERRNLLPSWPAQAAGLPIRLAARVRAAPTRAAGPVTDEDAARLRSLGYVQ